MVVEDERDLICTVRNYHVILDNLDKLIMANTYKALKKQN